MRSSSIVVWCVWGPMETQDVFVVSQNFVPAKKEKTYSTPKNRVIPTMHGIFWIILIHLVDCWWSIRGVNIPWILWILWVQWFFPKIAWFSWKCSQRRRRKDEQIMSPEMLKKFSKKKHEDGADVVRKQSRDDWIFFRYLKVHGWNIMISHRFTEMMFGHIYGGGFSRFNYRSNADKPGTLKNQILYNGCLVKLIQLKQPFSFVDVSGTRLMSLSEIVITNLVIVGWLL